MPVSIGPMGGYLSREPTALTTPELRRVALALHFAPVRGTQKGEVHARPHGAAERVRAVLLQLPSANGALPAELLPESVMASMT